MGVRRWLGGSSLVKGFSGGAAQEDLFTVDSNVPQVSPVQRSRRAYWRCRELDRRRAEAISATSSSSSSSCLQLPPQPCQAEDLPVEQACVSWTLRRALTCQLRLPEPLPPDPPVAAWGPERCAVRLERSVTVDCGVMSAQRLPATGPASAMANGSVTRFWRRRAASLDANSTSCGWSESSSRSPSSGRFAATRPRATSASPPPSGRSSSFFGGAIAAATRCTSTGRRSRTSSTFSERTRARRRGSSVDRRCEASDNGTFPCNRSAMHSPTLVSAGRAMASPRQQTQQQEHQRQELQQSLSTADCAGPWLPAPPACVVPSPSMLLFKPQAFASSGINGAAHEAVIPATRLPLAATVQRPTLRHGSLVKRGPMAAQLTAGTSSTGQLRDAHALFAEMLVPVSARVASSSSSVLSRPDFAHDGTSVCDARSAQETLVALQAVREARDACLGRMRPAPCPANSSYSASPRKRRGSAPPEQRWAGTVASAIGSTVHEQPHRAQLQLCSLEPPGRRALSLPPAKRLEPLNGMMPHFPSDTFLSTRTEPRHLRNIAHQIAFSRDADVNHASCVDEGSATMHSCASGVSSSSLSSPREGLDLLLPGVDDDGDDVDAG